MIEPDDALPASPQPPPPDHGAGPYRADEGRPIAKKSSRPAEDPAPARVCGGRKRDGTPCTRTISLTMTPDGLRCKDHGGARATGDRPRPPVGQIESAEDAEKICSWAYRQVIARRITHQEGNVPVALCREWRQSHDQTVLFERMKNLVARADENANTFRSMKERIDRAVARGLDV